MKRKTFKKDVITLLNGLEVEAYEWNDGTEVKVSCDSPEAVKAIKALFPECYSSESAVFIPVASGYRYWERKDVFIPNKWNKQMGLAGSTYLVVEPDGQVLHLPHDKARKELSFNREICTVTTWDDYDGDEWKREEVTRFR